MPIKINCPNHGGPLELPDNAAGKQVRCPMCNFVFEAPAAPDAPLNEAITQSPPSVAPSAAITDAPETSMPRQRRRDEDDEPRQRSASSGAGFGILAVVLIGGGLLALGGCCVVSMAGFVLFRAAPAQMEHDAPPMMIDVNEPRIIKPPEKKNVPMQKDDPK